MNESSEERPEKCDCGYPARWAANPNVPLRFDERFQEFHLLERDDGAYLILRYCFWCGGKLPESKRPDFFTKPEEAELAEIASLLKETKTAGEALAALGPPDHTFDGEPESGTAVDDKVVRWRRQHSYTSRWKSLHLTLLEMPDGSFERMTSGKWIGSPGEDAS